jgi:hypothetical protein
MAETDAGGRLGRSVLAILAGFVVVVALSIGTDVALHATHVYPPMGQPLTDALCALALAYRTVFAVGGSYLTARLAPRSPMRHALVGGLIGLILSTAGAVATWNSGAAYGPHWYPVALIVTALPTAWAGGKLRLLQIEPTRRDA